MPVGEQAVLDAVLRLDFESFGIKVFEHVNPRRIFLSNWHVKALHYELDQIRLRTFDRLIIAMPPRSGKSIAASVAFPAFVHGHDPTCRIISVSYSQELATKLHNDYRNVVTSRWYRRLFPRTRISARKDTETTTELTAGGARIATSIGGTLTGLGADLIVIDDPLKAADAYSQSAREKVNEWYGSTLLSRLNDKRNGAIVIVSQRLHVDDLIGHVLAHNRGWQLVELQAIASQDMQVWTGDNVFHWFRKGEVLRPQREPQTVLDELRREIGGMMFSAQYLQ